MKVKTNIFCLICNTKNEKDSYFCQECGIKLKTHSLLEKIIFWFGTLFFISIFFLEWIIVLDPSSDPLISGFLLFFLIPTTIFIIVSIITGIIEIPLGIIKRKFFRRYKFCKYCTIEYSSGVRYCQMCGAKIN